MPSVAAARSSAAGKTVSSKTDGEPWKTSPAPADPGFPPRAGRARDKTGIAPLIAWSIKSCNSIPIAGREGFSGSSTTVLRIEVPGQSKRLQGKYPNLVLVHGPVHASWLNQIEIYFSIIQRKVLTPNDFSSRQELADRLLAFGRHYETIARPFEWRFTRHELTRLLRRVGHPAVKAA